MFQYLALDRPLVLLFEPRAVGTSERYDPEEPVWTWGQVGEEVHDVEALPAAILQALSSPAVRIGERAA